MTLEEFQNELRAGIPNPLPAPQPYDTTVNHAPKRKDILTPLTSIPPSAARLPPLC